jgi:hypothetical protein
MHLNLLVLCTSINPWTQALLKYVSIVTFQHGGKPEGTEAPSVAAAGPDNPESQPTETRSFFYLYKSHTPLSQSPVLILRPFKRHKCI